MTQPTRTTFARRPGGALITAACTLLFALLASCVGAEDEMPQEATSGPEHKLTTPAENAGIVTRGRPGDATCLSGTEIPDKLRKELRELAGRTMGYLKDDNTDALWELAAPNAHERLDKETFAGNMRIVAERMGSPLDGVKVEIYSLTFEGNYGSVALCASRDAKDPAHRALQVSAKGEDMAFVFLPTSQPPFKRILAFAYRSVADSWRLSSVHTGAAAFRDNTHEYYREEADKFGHDKAVARLLMLEVALAFSKQAPYVTNADSYDVGEGIQALLADPKAVAALTRWPVGDAPLQVQQVTVTTTRTGIRPHIIYLTDHELDSKEAATEAEKVGAYVRNTYLLGTGESLLLLDTGQGVEGWADKLHEALAGRQLEAMVVTHGHPDHIGGVAQVLNRYGDMPVYKARCAEYDRDMEVSDLADGGRVSVEGVTLRALAPGSG